MGTLSHSSLVQDLRGKGRRGRRVANKKQGREIKCRKKGVHIYLELEQPKKMKVQLIKQLSTE